MQEISWEFLRTYRLSQKISALVLSAMTAFAIYIVVVLFVTTRTYQHERIRDDMISNFELRQKAIYDVYNFVQKIAISGKEFELELSSDHTLMRFSVRDNHNFELIEADFDNMAYIFNSLGWDEKIFETLLRKLKSANCISIYSGEPLTIGFQQNGSEIYAYKIFKESLNSDQLVQYSDRCAYLIYKNDVVFEYSGAGDNQHCFGNSE